MMRIFRTGGWFVLAVGLLLQIYLRVYPQIRPGCSWPDAGSRDLKMIAFGDPQIVGYSPLQKLRKRVDIYGNDLFLKQVASTMRRQTKPDLVAVMGDLLSNQWIPNEEFHRRVDRYEKIFPASDPGALVNVSGNHDIGYHGEMNDDRLNRFEERFGALNYVVDEVNEGALQYRIVVLNSLALDGPPHNDRAENATRDFLRSLEGYTGSTVLLTHIPMYKPQGICRDGPHFDYYPQQYGSVLKQQNHLSANATSLVMSSLFTGGQGGLIVTGHDHQGCFSKYIFEGEWMARADTDTTMPRNGEVKEFTVRSMMGEFGGNSGLIYGHVNQENHMQWSYTLCRFHLQHIWWVTQVVTIVGLLWVPLSYLIQCI